MNGEGKGAPTAWVEEVVTAADSDDCNGSPERAVCAVGGDEGAEDIGGEGAACMEGDEEDGDGCRGGVGGYPVVNCLEEGGGGDVDCSMVDGICGEDAVVPTLCSVGLVVVRVEREDVAVWDAEV